MTIISRAYALNHKGKPAKLYVYRNDGFCWGELRCGKLKLSVSTRKDHYDDDDDSAAEAFIRASRNPKCLSPSVLDMIGENKTTRATAVILDVHQVRRDERASEVAAFIMLCPHPMDQRIPIASGEQQCRICNVKFKFFPTLTEMRMQRWFYDSCTNTYIELWGIT